MVVGGRNLMRAESIPRNEEVEVNSRGTTKDIWMQEEESNRETCESSFGCWKQVKVGAKVKVQVRLGLGQLS
jgi:hypothetical protein